MIENLSLFWTLQIVGWSGYVLDRYLSSEGRFFPFHFLYLVTAFSLTFALRPIYHRVWKSQPAVLTIGAVIVACSIAAAFLWLVLGEIVFAALNLKAFPVPAQKNLPSYLADTFKYSLQHHKPFLFLSWSALYFGIKYWQSKREEEENALKSQALAQEAELKMLRYQLNPHFLFNSLNSASALVHESPQKTEKMLGELSEFLRYSLVHTKNENVTLRDEIEAVRSYLEIEQVRFEDKLKIKIDIAPETENFRLPSFLLHPLIENAVKYGMQTSSMPLEIEIRARKENGRLFLEISNTGKWIEMSANGFARNGKSTHIGLENVRKRIEQAFPNKHKFETFERDGRVFVRLEIGNK
ncbi:MAG TPA: histidine kinase [Pyrinomonadaceae bacterium]|nr:histidine kinase [Pyrinomonadaceae bacterium]